MVTCLCAFLTSLLTSLVTGVEGSLVQNGLTRLYISVVSIAEPPRDSGGPVHWPIELWGQTWFYKASAEPSAQHENTPIAEFLSWWFFLRFQPFPAMEMWENALTVHKSKKTQYASQAPAPSLHAVCLRGFPWHSQVSCHISETCKLSGRVETLICPWVQMCEWTVRPVRRPAVIELSAKARWRYLLRGRTHFRIILL